MSTPASVASGKSSPLMALEDAIARLLDRASVLDGAVSVPIAQALGRVLAQDLVAGLDVPGHDNSAMDGYAVRVADVLALSADGPGLPVSQRIPAGHVGQPLQAGTVARIFTGAPIPPGADAVIKQEDADVLDGGERVRFKGTVHLGQSIRRRGEDIAKGAVVLAAGTRLGPAQLGLAASLGFGDLPVRRSLKVALLSTGDELVTPGTVPPDQMPSGAIYNSNRYFLRALLERLGCVVQDLGIVQDTLPATLDALRQAATSHDVIVSSGGVSVGEEDHVKPAVTQLGGLDLWQVSMKPGKPFAYGWIDRPGPSGPCHFIGLPGNPVSSFVTFALLARPFLLRLSGDGRDLGVPPSIPMVAHFDSLKPDARREFLRVKRNARGGLDAFQNQGSGVLSSMAWADGLVSKPAGASIQAGDTVDYIPFDTLLF